MIWWWRRRILIWRRIPDAFSDVTSYSRERIESQLFAFSLGAHRIFRSGRMPLAVQCSPSRFCDAVSGYAVLHAALSFETCVLETVVRDRFARDVPRELPLATILVRAHAQIATQPGQDLNLLDLRKSGCKDLGAPAESTLGRHFAAGQALGRSIYHEHAYVDGMLYHSRITGEDCLAVFDRAVRKLMVLDAAELKDCARLLPLLQAQGIRLS